MLSGGAHPSLRGADGTTVLAALAAVALWAAAGAPAAAMQRPGDLCWAAVDQAAAQIGAPQPLLRAIALVESGRGSGDARAPWPWTVNLDGDSYYFDTRAEGEAFVRDALARGEVSFDVGCLQVNHRWHGPAFASVEEMFDPQANADYAARFLTELREETGDWMTAAGYYHSRTPKFFERYSRKVVQTLASLPAVAPAALVEIARRPALVAEATRAHAQGRRQAGAHAQGRRQARRAETPIQTPPPAAPTVVLAPPTIAPPRRRLNPLRPAAWRGLLRAARGALIGGDGGGGAVARAPLPDAPPPTAPPPPRSSAGAPPATGGVALALWDAAARGAPIAPTR